jgi:hypothetical protein
MVRTDPQSFPLWNLLGVGIRLVRKGLSHQPQVRDLRYGVDLLSDFALFLFAHWRPCIWWHPGMVALLAHRCADTIGFAPSPLSLQYPCGSNDVPCLVYMIQ